MRGDTDTVHRLQAKLEGAASIDIAGTLAEDAQHTKQWHLPADGAPIVPGYAHRARCRHSHSLLVGHRFPRRRARQSARHPWIEVEVADQRRQATRAVGLAHATDANDDDTHVLRTLVVDEHGNVLEHHEMPRFRTQIATQTLAPRRAQAIRYARSSVPKLVAICR